MKAKEVYESWLNDPNIDDETKKELIAIENDENEIEDRFFQELEFGTAGLRGIIGAGTNRMNKYTVCKATQGLADYINTFYDGGINEKRLEIVPGKTVKPEKAVAIACDSRHMSAEFSDFAAACLNANGIKTYVFESLRPTPELSFTIRELNCVSGINITASHNPAIYNGYKAYWADGAQVTPPYDTGIMECVSKVTNISTPKFMDREEAKAKGLYVEIGKEMDEKYLAAILNQMKEPELTKKNGRDVTIAYTPLNGAGIKIVPEALKRAGFTNVHIVKEQAEPDGNFPTVPFPNPEIATNFELVEKLGSEVGADICIATDPDADRLGVHVPDREGKYHELTGNMTGNFICAYILDRLKEQGRLPEDGIVIRSIVTTRLYDVIAAAYGIKVKEVLTGFKWIGKAMLDIEKSGEGTFIFGFEESIGFLIGDHARDKDSCVTALILSEICAYYKNKGICLWDAVQQMYDKFGYSVEHTVSLVKKGIEGMKEIKGIMEDIRSNPPKAVAGYEVKKVMDYNKPETTGIPKSNVMFFVFDGAWAAVRPSGTEPKIKYYFGVQDSNEKSAREKLEKLEKGLINE